MTRRSGPDMAYADRKRGGRPQVNFSLPIEVVELIVQLASKLGTTRSAVVAMAVQELARSVRTRSHKS